MVTPLVQSVMGDWRMEDDAFLASFALPAAQERVDVLAALNPLAGESRLRFDAEEHKYYRDGNLVPKSVTALVKSYGLQQEFITPYTPEQNGMIERFFRTLKEECVSCFRSGTATSAPALSPFTIAMICSSLNFDFLMTPPGPRKA